MLQLIEVPATWTNTSNDWVYLYGNATITITDPAGVALGTTNAPCWVPPGFSIVGTNNFQGLQGKLMDFAGFLSRGGGKLLIPGGSLQYTVGAGQKPLTESEVWANGAQSYSLSEAEVWTHN